MSHVRTTRTDPEAWVHVGTQTWHPAEIMVQTDEIGLGKGPERGQIRPCIVVTLIPRTGNTGHWIALSPEDARHLISNLSASLKEVAP